MTDTTELLKTVNGSGFPLQIALQAAVAAECPAWRVVHREHAWHNRIDGSTGFIDFVARHEQTHDCAVIECKRVQASTWVFLSHNGIARQTLKTRGWLLKYQGKNVTHCGWSEVRVGPQTPEANFCTLRGQSTNDKNTFLERVASELVSATEALAMEEREFRPERDEFARMYFNVIVTTAQLRFAEFKYEDLVRDEGALTSANFLEIPYVRVRKQFSTRPVSISVNDWFRSDNLDARRENTVFVVNAKHFTSFLNALDVTKIEVPH
jgi:hypothetical protein